jgi:hypothetical protein
MLTSLALCTLLASSSVANDVLEPVAAAEPLFAAAALPAWNDPAGACCFSVSLYYSDIELDEIDVEDSDESGTLGDVPRERIGVQFGFGPGYARVYQEESDELEGYGFGLGAQGAFLADPQARTGFLVDYEISADLSFLDEDTLDAELTHLWLEGRIGAGIAIESFRAAAGLAGSFVTGRLEIPGLEDIDLEGENFGPYVGFEYVPREVPITARIDLYLGDIDGVVLAIGYAF